MNRLSTERRAQVIGCLCEGMSIRATVRVTGVAKSTIVKLVADLGAAATDYMDGAFQSLFIERVEADEIWAFCHAKQKRDCQAGEGPPSSSAGHLILTHYRDAGTREMPIRCV